MKTLDRYIIKQFLTNFGILFVVVMLLFVVVDLIVDLDEFVQAGDVHRDSWFGVPLLATVMTAVDYYVPVLILVYVFFNGLIVVGAMGFTIVGLQRHRELTAVIASGVSLYRVAAPILVTGVALSVVTLPVQEFLLPPMAPKLVRNKSELKQPKQGLESREVYYARADAGSNDLLSASRFDAGDGRLTDLRILSRDAGGSTRLIITADEAVWEETAPNEEGEMPGAGGRWVLTNGLAEEPQSRASAESATARPVRRVVSYETELSPTVMLARRDALYANLLSVRTLEALAGNDAVSPEQRDKVTQIIASRFSLMVLNVLVLVIGLPFFLRRLPGNTLQSSLRAAALCIGAWGGGLLMLQMSAGALPVGGPVLVAWLPVALYLPVAGWLLQTIES
ncbi:MAG: LptF/LptG family permease [Planctomycetota bacterium]